MKCGGYFFKQKALLRIFIFFENKQLTYNKIQYHDYDLRYELNQNGINLKLCYKYKEHKLLNAQGKQPAAVKLCHLKNKSRKTFSLCRENPDAVCHKRKQYRSQPRYDV